MIPDLLKEILNVFGDDLFELYSEAEVDDVVKKNISEILMGANTNDVQEVKAVLEQLVKEDNFSVMKSIAEKYTSGLNFESEGIRNLFQELSVLLTAY